MAKSLEQCTRMDEGYEDLRNEYIALWRHIHWDDYDDPVTTRLFNDSRSAWHRYWVQYRHGD